MISPIDLPLRLRAPSIREIEHLHRIAQRCFLAIEQSEWRMICSLYFIRSNFGSTLSKMTHLFLLAAYLLLMRKIASVFL